MLILQPANPFDSLEMTAWSTLATAVLVLTALVIALVAGSTLMQIQRKQAEELARLRHEVTELRLQQPAADSNVSAPPTIGTATRVYQVGDPVVITDGPHRGDYGTIAPPPDWLRQGFVCVEFERDGGRRYMPASKLAPLDR